MKNMIEGMLLGGLAVLTYTKYKDGSMRRAIKNFKPMIECYIEDMKN